MVSNFMERHEAYMYNKQEEREAQKEQEERRLIEIEEKKKRNAERDAELRDQQKDQVSPYYCNFFFIGKAKTEQGVEEEVRG